MPIVPHIVVQGADRAAAFYAEAFGAEEVSRIPVPDGRLMSVQLMIGGGLLHLADEFPEMGVLAPPTIGGTPVVLALETDDAAAVFGRAVAGVAAVRHQPAAILGGDGLWQSVEAVWMRWPFGLLQRVVPQVCIGSAAAGMFL
jgi:PhnB protein